MESHSIAGSASREVMKGTLMSAPKARTRVLIVDDSRLSCQILSAIVNADPDLTVVGVAYNGKEALELIPKIQPDLITMDIAMPVMDGFEATKHIMAYDPRPILIISSLVFKGGMDLAFQSLAYGALDVMEKTLCEAGSSGTHGRGGALVERIKLLARVKVIAHPLAKFDRARTGQGPAPPRAAGRRLVAIASSTGGPQALLRILRAFPKGFPCGIAIVQHLSVGFAEGLVDWLRSECGIGITLATDGARVEPGVAYVAPAEHHMQVSAGGIIQLIDGEPVEGHKPSANVLLSSVAKVYGAGAIGVVLSGMGHDGAIGLQQIHSAQGVVVAQDEATSIVFGMPKAAIELGVAHKILPVDQIAGYLLTILGTSKGARA